MLHNYPGDIDKVDDSFKSDRDILIAIISKKEYGYYIKYGNHTIRNDMEIVEMAISDSSYNIKYAGEIILRDTDFLIEMIKKQPNCFNSLPEEVQKNVEEKMIELGLQNFIIDLNNSSNSDKDNEGDDGLPF